MAAAAELLCKTAAESISLCAKGSGIRTVIYDQGQKLSFSVRPQLQALVNGVIQERKLLEDVLEESGIMKGPSSPPDGYDELLLLVRTSP